MPKHRHDPEKPETVSNFKALAQAFRSPPAMSVDRGDYNLGVSYQPLIAIKPNVPLEQAQRESLAELIHVLLSVPDLPTKCFVEAIDHWFADRNEKIETDPVVLIARPTDKTPSES